MNSKVVCAGTESCSDVETGTGIGAAAPFVIDAFVLSIGLLGSADVEGVNLGAVAEREEPYKGALNGDDVDAKREDSDLKLGEEAGTDAVENTDDKGIVGVTVGVGILTNLFKFLLEVPCLPSASIIGIRGADPESFPSTMS